MSVESDRAKGILCPVCDACKNFTGVQTDEYVIFGMTMAVMIPDKQLAECLCRPHANFFADYLYAMIEKGVEHMKADSPTEQTKYIDPKLKGMN